MLSSAEPDARRSDLLVDGRLGVIRSVSPLSQPPGMPRSCRAYTAEVSATRWFAPWIADGVTAGAAFDDDEQARACAIGEAVERYCGNAVPDDLVFNSFTALARSGRRAIDPVELVLHSSRQYDDPGFPLVPLTRELEIAWVPGRDLTGGADVLVPASLVYLNYFAGRRADEPPTNLPVNGGIACGESREHAERSALEELVERDATAIWWLSDAATAGIELGDQGWVASVMADPDPADLAWLLLRIPTVFGVPVVGAFLEDKARRVVGFGVACRSDAERAARKALTEAVLMHVVSRELLDHDGSFWTAVRSGARDRRPYKPFRGDRAYLDEFRADWHDVHDMELHAQLYLDPRMQGAPLDRLRAPTSYIGMNQIAAVPNDQAHQTYLAALSARGFRAFSVDLTTPDIAAAGLHVVRIVVPGLYGLAPAAFPLLGGQRLVKEPLEQEWTDRPLDESNLVRQPLPFA